MIKELFDEQRELIDYFFDSLDVNAVEELFNLLLSCSGTVIFTGIGKSGFIAKKIAMTLLSTGTRALALSAVDALHGDIGIVSENDLFVVLSKSGESEELLNLIPFVRNKGVQIIGISSNKESRLAQASNLHLTLPLKKELCPFDLAPTTSPSLQLIFGDVIATGLMKAKKYSLDQYAKNHPAGRIGKRIITKVEDLMLKGEAIPLCGPKEKLVDTFEEFSNKHCGCLVVVDKEQKLLGIFTDGDLRRRLQVLGQGILQQPIEELMVKNPRYIEHNLLAWEAMKKMEADQKNPIMILPVLKEKKVVGLIKMHDIIQAGI